MEWKCEERLKGSCTRSLSGVFEYWYYPMGGKEFACLKAVTVTCGWIVGAAFQLSLEEHG
jgi:hypothetical protein